MKKNSKKNFPVLKISVIVLLIFIISANFWVINKNEDVFTQAKKQLFSLNKGESYTGRLNLWRLLVQANDWDSAACLESGLNTIDITNYKSQYQPAELQKKIVSLESKTDKSTEDYLELARTYILLDQKPLAINAIQTARQLDPIRDDIDRLYYSLSQ